MNNLETFNQKLDRFNGNGMEELSAIFTDFNSNALRLEESYNQLQNRVKEIDREMALANECLNNKVQELNSLTGYLNSILESMHSGTVGIDTNGKIMTFNKAAEKILKVKANDVIGKDVRSTLKHISGFADLLVESMSKEKAILNLERIIGTNGSTKYIESSISILKDINGEVTGVVEIFQDLSEIYELKGRLSSASNLISVGTMAASVAHEIRNPLNGVEGFARILERELGGGKNLKLVKNIIRGTKNINRIVTDLLLLARPIKLNLRDSKLSDVVDKSLVFVSKELNQDNSNQIRVVKNYSHIDDTVSCDPERLQQAFLNIMLNAIQSMQDGGQITVSLNKSRLNNGPGIQISFSDTGMGISSDSIKKVFEPFFTTKNDGTGLGLAIVRNIVELHGGHVVINSKDKKGTTFIVNLPIKHRLNKKAIEVANRISQMSSLQQTIPALRMNCDTANLVN